MAFNRAILTANTVDGLVYWSDGITKFSGYMLIGLAKPAGVTEVYINDSLRKLRYPDWAYIRVIDGKIDQEPQLCFSSSMIPPTTGYAVYWYDEHGNRITTPTPSVITVNASPFAISVPSMSLPATPTTPPTPEV